MPSRRGALGSLLVRIAEIVITQCFGSTPQSYVNTPYIAFSLGRHVAVLIVEEMPDSLWLCRAPNEAHVNAGADRGGEHGERDHQHGVPPELVLRA